MSDEKSIADTLDDLRYCIALSVRYHESLERWYDWWDRMAKAISVVGGAATVGALIANAGAQTWIAVLITIASGVALIFSFSEKARRHFELRKRYLLLEAEIIVVEAPLDARALAKFESRVALIEADEPPKLSTLVQHCQNQIDRAQRRPVDHPVPWWKLLFAYWFDMPATLKKGEPEAG